ncbi:MAG: type I-E CRISPR-associated protein Cse1/CasA [Candidatus Anammoxibacter sp.]
MPVPNRFNLVDEPWVPVAGRGLVGLATVFSDHSLSALGGNPVQKIALTKLLLAIAQSACTPTDDEDWKTLGASGMAKKSLDYLTAKRDLFWLYGERPFLQMPVIANIIFNDIKEKNKEPKILGSGDFPNLPNDNNTILLQSESPNCMSDAEKTLFILSLMSFALAGKQCHCNNMKPAIVGPSLGRACYLHSYFEAESIFETLFLNILTTENINNLKFLSEGVGVPIWEKTSIDTISNTYLDMLVPACRFVFLHDERIYMLEGLKYPNHKEGWAELTMAINRSGKDIRVLQADTEKKPWRSLTSILSFIYDQSGYECRQLIYGREKLKISDIQNIRIWSGGLKVTGDSFGQKVKGTDDYIESEIQLATSALGKDWFSKLKQEMDELEGIAQELKRSVYKANKRDIKESKEKDKRSVSISNETETLFWQLCEQKFQELVDACQTVSLDPSSEEVKKLRRVFAEFVNKAYNTYCPKDTARQMDAWVANRPNLSKYLY